MLIVVRFGFRPLEHEDAVQFVVHQLYPSFKLCHVFRHKARGSLARKEEPCFLTKSYTHYYREQRGVHV